MIAYDYKGYDIETGELLSLPRTPEIEAIARELMQYLATHEIYQREGKMYGVLLVESLAGERQILKAFSGLLNGSGVVEGWVPPIPGRETVRLPESRTLEQLSEIAQELMTLEALPERQEYARRSAEFAAKLDDIALLHQQRKQQRRDRRQHPVTEEILQQLEAQSRLDKRERKQLKSARDAALNSLQSAIAAADTRIKELKHQRRELSRELQEQMHDAYLLLNFAGKSRSLRELMPQGLPTGTGDCCAPKLLHYAAENALKPIAMAEFWWGNSTDDKIAGNFYPACQERCEPIMGFLLSGLNRADLPIIYQDEWIIAINKPSGLLSVPGRYLETQDSVLSRLRRAFPGIEAVHRLDLETSGILLLAKDAKTYKNLTRQFQNRQVQKLYEAVLDGILNIDRGAIAIPLWGNPENRPYQEVNWKCGKPSLTEFRVMAREGNYSRVEFMPLTGRTHQIRVHAADKAGLGIAILGDRLYASHFATTRLHLHARELTFIHPQSQELRHLQVATPF